MSMLTLMKRKKETIFHSKKSLLNHDVEARSKICESKEFDGVQVFEIVGYI